MYGQLGHLILTIRIRVDQLRNLRRLLDSQGAIEPNIHGQWFVVYGSITLYSPKIQQTQIFIGASNGQKVWLNGKLVHEDYTRYAFGEHNVGLPNIFSDHATKGKKCAVGPN